MCMCFHFMLNITHLLLYKMFSDIFPLRSVSLSRIPRVINIPEPIDFPSVERYGRKKTPRILLDLGKPRRNKHPTSSLFSPSRAIDSEITRALWEWLLHEGNSSRNHCHWLTDASEWGVRREARWWVREGRGGLYLVVKGMILWIRGISVRGSVLDGLFACSRVMR